MSSFKEVDRAALLEGLDRGRFRQALAFIEAEPEVGANPDDLLLRAELALYRDRFEEARGFVDQLGNSELWIDDDTEIGSTARRARLLRVEISCFTGDLGAAERLVRPVLDAAARAGDRLSELRALYDAARIARHRADWTVAIDRLDLALDLARTLGNTFYEGRLSYTLGYCWYNLNDVDRAVPYLRSALGLLTESEDLRFRSTVEIFYGCLLCDSGELDAALDLLEHAEATAADLGVVSDVVTARMNAARTRLALGRYDEAERALAQLLAWEREPGITSIELMTLRLLAITQCVSGRAAEAERTAAEALRLADIGGNEVDRLEARLLLARARSLGGAHGATSELEALVVEVDAGAIPYLQAEARINLARALRPADPTAARALCDVARSMPVVGSYSWLRHELDLVERELRHAPICISDNGTLIMDARLGWPDLKAAREATERYWLERALAETGGNVSAASRLLGLTRNEGHYLYHLVLKGVPARPSRSKNANAPAQRPRRRPRTRT